MEGERGHAHISESWFNETATASVIIGMSNPRSSRIAAIAAAVLLAACGSGSSTASGSAPTVKGSVTKEVVVQNYTFPAITVAPGASIGFIDRDAEAHTVTADDATFSIGPFDTSTPPETLIAPTVPGTYAFHCKIHPTMHGSLVVQQP